MCNFRKYGGKKIWPNVHTNVDSVFELPLNVSGPGFRGARVLLRRAQLASASLLFES